MAEAHSTDELVSVNAFLRDGHVIAVPSGNMAVLYRVRNDPVKGETEFVYDGIGVLTGAFNTVRRWRRD